MDAGTGPYAIESYTPDKEVLLAAYDGYWGGWDGAHYDKVLVSITPEAAVQQQMLDGEIVLTADVAGTAFAATASATSISAGNDSVDGGAGIDMLKMRLPRVSRLRRTRSCVQ